MTTWQSRTRRAAVALIAAAAVGTMLAAPSQAATKKFTMKQVAKHSSATDCWTSINGAVYNLTPWIAQHPGGSSAILGLCGKDGSAKFNGQHGGQASQASALAKYKIGTLKK